ncbi:PREDICTED: uncharacterized protein LOC109171934 [Ipomoea nil]|uniref:uncharacterized protein LOC109171934 n=1 Tax=Ipomoea nil TaxID=35883 RepID=UPI00090098CF|nr:PREDICTED: uncharacterized protein LOC109171934 [Ipomoea nil]
MAWQTPLVNTIRSQMAATNPTVTVPATTNPVGPPPGFATYDPRDRTDPLHLHPNESPSLQLVTAQLEGRSNYHPWARAMEMALRSKNKMGLVDGTLAIPSKSDPRYFYWDQCNNMVLSWILRAVSPTIGRSVPWINTAEGVSKDLKKRFSQQDVFRIAEIQSEIYRTKQGTSSVNDYFTQLKLLWDELFVLRPVPSYECSSRCECGNKISEKIRAQLENDMLSSFLIGLNDNFGNTKRQIMLMKPLPDVGEAFSMVSQQERKITVESSILDENLTGAGVFFTKYEGKKSYPNQKQKPVCSFCGYTGHTIEKCYKKHGYPPSWKPRNKGMGAVNQVQSNLQEPGKSETDQSLFNQEDYKRFLEFKKQSEAISSPLQTAPQVNAIAANFIPNAAVEGKTINYNNELRNSESIWILDSGATHHIVCKLSLLKNPKEVQGIHVDLPNGHQAQVSHIGTVQLSTDLVLFNVLCDQLQGNMIGIAELKKGLYQLTLPDFLFCKPAYSQDDQSDETNLETDLVLPSQLISGLDNDDQVQEITTDPRDHHQAQGDTDG